MGFSKISSSVTSKRVLILLFLIFIQVTQSCRAQTTGVIGDYEFTMYLDGAFTGKTTMTRHSTSGSITTYFGTFSGGTHVSRSNIKLSHSNKGYVTITDWNSYSDQEHNLIKSDSTWSLHITGYQQVTYTSVYEYGDYVVLQDTDTVYEETYTRRYYEDGSFVEETECRDVVTAEDVEYKQNQQCLRIRTDSYEDGAYDGYSLSWVNEEGKLIQQNGYDENGILYISIKLASGFDIFPFIIIGIVGIVAAACIFLYMRNRSKRDKLYDVNTHWREQRKTPAYWERESLGQPRGYGDRVSCSKCGMKIPASSLFCTFCGEKMADEYDNSVHRQQTLKCTRCARPIPENSKYCPTCGKKVGN